MTIKFRWRDPDLQVVTLLRVTSEQFEILKQSDYENAKNIIKEQISPRLREFSLDPAKRDKALIVAQKLGVNINERGESMTMSILSPQMFTKFPSPGPVHYMIYCCAWNTSYRAYGN